MSGTEREGGACIYFLEEAIVRLFSLRTHGAVVDVDGADQMNFLDQGGVGFQPFSLNVSEGSASLSDEQGILSTPSPAHDEFSQANHIRRGEFQARYDRRASQGKVLTRLMMETFIHSGIIS